MAAPNAPDWWSDRSPSRRLPVGTVRRAVRITGRPLLSPRIPLGLQRRLLSALAGGPPAPLVGASFLEARLGGVPTLAVTARNARVAGRAVLYLHGGGFVSGSPETACGVATILSAATGATVHMVRYGLSPEHPYPDAVDEALRAYAALTSSSHGVQEVILAGDSAGGNLALAAALRLRDDGTSGGPLARARPAPVAILLFAPWLDLTLSGGSYRTNAAADALLRADWLQQRCVRAYSGAGSPDSPGISPVFADLAGLPPIVVQTGGDDLLLSDSELLVERATRAGVEVVYHRVDGLWHDFQLNAGILAEADSSVAEAGAAAARYFADEVGSSPAEERSGLRVAILGTGFAGIAAAIEMLKIPDVELVVFERAHEVGGVWRQNTYPGAACDVPSIWYSYSFEQRSDWAQRYSAWHEIKTYLKSVADKYDVTPRIRFNAEIIEAHFDDERSVWQLTDNAGGMHEVDVFIPATGQLSNPAYPKIPGLDSFAGTAFHSAHWDHGCDLTHRRVGVIGNGSSALQFVPEVAKSAGHLTVFQRTASWILPKSNPPKKDSLGSRMFDRAAGVKINRWAVHVLAEILGDGFNTNRAITLAGARAIGKRHLRTQVTEPATREKLKPTIEIGCKRIGLSNDYYPTFNRDNVSLVTEDIRKITPTGVVTTDGTEHELDVLIFGTGFTASEFLAPMTVRGRRGGTLSERWNGEPVAYLGMSVPDFPNMFIMYGPNTNVGSGSIVYMLEAQAVHIGRAVDLLRGTPADATLEVRPDVFEAFDHEMQQKTGRSVYVGCNSWYRSPNGRITANWPDWAFRFTRRASTFESSAYRVISGPVPSGSASGRHTADTAG